MFRLQLFKIRAFTFGSLSSFLSAARPRRADVHADHLAAGHLAAQPRLQLRVDPAVGRHLHAAALGRHRDRRSGVGLPVRPLTGRGCSPPAACWSPPSAFVLLDLLPTDFDYPAFALVILLCGIGTGLFASPNRACGDEQPAAAVARIGQRHEHHLPELGPGALDRGVLHPDDRRAVRRPWPRRSRAGLQAHGVARPRPRPGRRTCRRCRSCSPRSSATTRSSTCSARRVLSSLPASASAQLTSRVLLPVADLGAVPESGCTRRSCSPSWPAWSRRSRPGRAARTPPPRWSIRRRRPTQRIRRTRPTQRIRSTRPTRPTSSTPA